MPDRLARAQRAVKVRDLAALGAEMEADTLAMHGVMMTSQPSLLYWQPGTVAVLQAVRDWRAGGLGVWFTMDAGSNVHCFCEAAAAAEVQARLRNVPGVQDVLVSGPGAGVRLVEWHLF